MKLALTLDYDLAEGFLGPYLTGLREGRAVAGACTACHRIALPPETTCPCGARRFAAHTLSGKATVLWRTTGTDGDMALVRFDGADTLSVARLDGFGGNRGAGHGTTRQRTGARARDGGTDGMIAMQSWTDADLAALNLYRAKDEDGTTLQIRWSEDTNIHAMTLGRHLGPGDRDRTAMIFEAPDGTVTRQTFAEVDRAATGLAATLRAQGFGRGDLIGLHLGQHPDTAIAHMAICKIGGVAVTLSQLYGPDTLVHALNDCRTRAILTDRAAWSLLDATPSRT
jgi:hypothetical protein